MSKNSGGQGVLRVVIFREADYWLAQGLEADVGAQGEHLADLLQRLRLVLDVEADLSALPPSPKYFQDLWPARSGEFEPIEPIGPPPPYQRILFAVVA